MNKRKINIRCVNKKCKTLNSIEEKFCHRCNTPVVKKYLWIKGELSKDYPIGELIEDRYLLCYPKTVLDTKPDVINPTPDDIPDEIKPYLRLFSHRLHLPQIYSYLKFPETIWFLEHESVPIDSQGRLVYPKFFPSIESNLSGVSALRQLNWLWQIVQLWKPLEKQKALSSLFIAENIRVDGSIVKLIELKLDQEDCVPHLDHLGELWSAWLPYIAPQIKDIVEKIILSLQQNLIKDVDELLNILDQTIYILGNNFYDRHYQLITATDVGKARKNNEDCCYPPVDELKQTKKGLETLTIVCDGLGGQDKGEVASELAINVINRSIKNSYKETLQMTIYNKDWTPLIDAGKLYKAISEANTEILKINKSEKREKRRRMGTTATIGMALAHEAYLANVGDSRIYWITQKTCHQVSIDDDVATRKVKQGEDLYRAIAADPKAGALLQALGMSDSQHLRVHIRRFILDENAVFLLCSDGLSDYDRVEQYWRSELRPIITGKVDLETASKNLMKIAMEKNGHDNITIALLYCQVKEKDEPENAQELSWKYLNEIIPELPHPQSKNKFVSNILKTKKSSQIQILIVAIGVIIATAIGVWFFTSQKSSNNDTIENQEINKPNEN